MKRSKPGDGWGDTDSDGCDGETPNWPLQGATFVIASQFDEDERSDLANTLTCLGAKLSDTTMTESVTHLLCENTDDCQEYKQVVASQQQIQVVTSAW